MHPFSPEGKLKWIGDSAQYFPFRIPEASFQHRRVATSIPQPAGGAFQEKGVGKRLETEGTMSLSRGRWTPRPKGLSRLGCAGLVTRRVAERGPFPLGRPGAPGAGVRGQSRPHPEVAAPHPPLPSPWASPGLAPGCARHEPWNGPRPRLETPSCSQRRSTAAES